MRRRSGLKKDFGSIVVERALPGIICLFVAGCAVPNKSLYPPPAGRPARTVYVVNHGLLHTGVAVQQSDTAWNLARES